MKEGKSSAGTSNKSKREGSGAVAAKPHKRTLLSSRLMRMKKKPSSTSLKKKHIMDARSEILRNTAINSFRVDEKPTKQLILTRMKELRAREKRQKEVAAYHNFMLQMHSLLPAFSKDSDEFEEEDEEEDEDFLVSGNDDGEEGVEFDDEEEGSEEEEDSDDDELEFEEGEEDAGVDDLEDEDV